MIFSNNKNKYHYYLISFVFFIFIVKLILFFKNQISLRTNMRQLISYDKEKKINKEKYMNIASTFCSITKVQLRPLMNCTFSNIENNQQLYHQPWETLFYKAAEENVHHVLTFLDGKSLISLQNTCHYFKKLGNNDYLWSTLCQKEWGITPEQLLSRARPGLKSNKKLHLCCGKNPTSKDIYQYALSTLNRLKQEIVRSQYKNSFERTFQTPRPTILEVTLHQ